MADKKITLSIAGQEVVCNFGVNYFYKFYNEITGNDPLVKGFGEVEGVALLNVCCPYSIWSPHPSNIKAASSISIE